MLIKDVLYTFVRLQYVIGCHSTCAKGNLQNGICSGAGCCRADVPKDIRYFSSYFNRNYTTSQDSPCSYMVVMQKEAFSFNISYVKSTVFYDTYNGTVPIVLNWEIHRQTCEVARQSMSSYACVSSNSACMNSTNEQGYRCICSHGYEGNPYIMDGCQGYFLFPASQYNLHSNTFVECSKKKNIRCLSIKS
jgi:hypothetical protein